MGQHSRLECAGATCTKNRTTMLPGCSARGVGKRHGRGGTVNGHPGHAHLCPRRGGAEPVRGGHRARADAGHHLQTHPGAGGRAVRAPLRPHHALDPHHGGRRGVPGSCRAHPLRDRGRARQRRRQGEQAEGQAQDRGAGVSRSALCRPGAVRVRARLPRDRRARRPARPAGQSAGGWLRRRHPHGRTVGLLADRQAAGSRPARDRRLAGLSGPQRLPAAAPGSRPGTIA